MKDTLKFYFGKQTIHRKALLVCLLIPLVVGGISGFLTKDAMESFQSLNKPPLSPPGWVFPVVWTILYILMGLGSYMVWRSDSPLQKSALGLYAIQLFVNFMWPILFFSFAQYLVSFFWLVFLFLLIVTMFYYFYRAEPLAAWLQIPYMLWILFAGYLNLSIYFLNQ